MKLTKQQMGELEAERVLQEGHSIFGNEEAHGNLFYLSLHESTCRKIVPDHQVVWLRNTDTTWWCSLCAKPDLGVWTRLERIHYLAKGRCDTICYQCNQTIIRSYNVSTCFDCKMTWWENREAYDRDDDAAIDVHEREQRA